MDDLNFWGHLPSRRDSTQGTYDTAQICLNGHVINEFAQTQPAGNQIHCSSCGEETIMSCPHCSSKIKGYYRIPGVIGIFDYSRPAFCDNCGKPYAWTVRSWEAMNELIEFSEGLNDTEKQDFKQSVGDLVVETPKSKVAALKFKSYIAKVGKDMANGIREIAVDLISETAKKAIWGG